MNSLLNQPSTFRGRNRKRKNRPSNINTKFSWTARENDAIMFRGSYAITAPYTVPASGNAPTTYLLSPSSGNLGTRALAMNPLYLKYRINALKIRFISGVPSTTAGLYVTGVVDDVDTTTVSNAYHPDELRISSTQSAFKDTTLLWQPVDKNKWYYTNLTTTGDTNPDARLEVPATLFIQVGSPAPPSSTVLGTFYIEYEIVFKGAAPSAIT